MWGWGRNDGEVEVDSNYISRVYHLQTKDGNLPIKLLNEDWLKLVMKVLWGAEWRKVDAGVSRCRS